MASFSAEHFITRFRRWGHNAALGIGFAAQGEDWVELTLPYAPHLAADAATGILASGPIVTLMDTATSLAVWAVRGRFEPQATLDFRVDYLRAAVPGRTVHGRGECYRLTSRIAFVRGQAHDGEPDDPIAHVAGTFMLLEDPA